MSRRRRVGFTGVLAGALLACAFASVSSAANAETVSAGQRDRARALVYSGREKRARGAMSEALEDFERAHAIMRVPTTAIELAKTRVASGLLLEAKKLLDDELDVHASSPEPRAFAAARAEAALLLERLNARLPTLTISPPAVRAAVLLDGVAVPPASLGTAMRVNPGTHRIVFQVDERETRRAIFVAASSHETVRYEPPEPAPVASDIVTRPASATNGTPIGTPHAPSSGASSSNALVYIGASILGAGAVTGTVFGAMTLDTRSSVDARCAVSCGEEMDDDIRRGKAFGTVSTVAFAAAGAGAVLLVYGLLFPETGAGRSPAVGRGTAPTFRF